MHQNRRNPLKILMIGCGRSAHSTAVAIDSHPAMKLSAVVDQNRDAARTFSDSFNCSYYASLDEYISLGGRPECGVLCTPPAQTTDFAIRLMQWRISVFCEGPFAVDSASAQKMIDTSRTFGVQLMAGARFRYIADLIQARGLIQSGILGKILVFEIDFRNYGDTDDYTGIWPDRETQGVVMDRGNHAIDIARYFFGPIMRLRAEEVSKYKSSDLEDTVRLDIRSVSGVIGTAHLSRTLKNPREDYIRIYGTRGTLCIGWKASAYRLYGFADWTKFGEGFSKLRAVGRQMENLLHAIRDEATPETTPEDGYESVRALEAVYRSLSTEEWMELSSDPVARIERKFRVVRPA